eukprot:12948766-Heterocapsa_arctica.AAC.1
MQCPRRGPLQLGRKVLRIPDSEQGEGGISKAGGKTLAIRISGAQLPIPDTDPNEVSSQHRAVAQHAARPKREAAGMPQGPPDQARGHHPDNELARDTHRHACNPVPAFRMAIPIAKVPNVRKTIIPPTGPGLHTVRLVAEAGSHHLPAEPAPEPGQIQSQSH